MLGQLLPSCLVTNVAIPMAFGLLPFSGASGHVLPRSEGTDVSSSMLSLLHDVRQTSESKGGTMDFTFWYDPYVLQMPFFAKTENNKDEAAWLIAGGKNALELHSECKKLRSSTNLRSDREVIVCNPEDPDGRFHDTLFVREAMEAPMQNCKSLQKEDVPVLPTESQGILQPTKDADTPDPSEDHSDASDLLGYDSWSFQHFLDGPALRIAQNQQIYKKYNAKLILQIHEGEGIGYNNPLVPKMVAKAGFAKAQQAYCGGWNTQTPCEDGNQKVGVSLGCSSPPFHPRLASVWRGLMGVHDDVPSEGGMLVLSSRNDQYRNNAARVNNNGRAVLNEPEVEDLCKKLAKEYGLKYVKLSKPILESVENVVEYFGKVKLMVGPHGGALYNSWFMPKDSGLIELGGPGSSYFWDRAARFGQRYGILYGDFKGQAPWRSDMTVNVQDLENLMRQVMNAPDKLDNAPVKVHKDSQTLPVTVGIMDGAQGVATDAQGRDQA